MIGSIIGGLIGQGGANAAAGMAQSAGAQAMNNAQGQEQANTSNSSPYSALGIRGTSVLGGLLGYGTLTNPGGQGSTYDFKTDPGAYGASLGNFNAFRTATNAQNLPAYNPVQPVNAISSTFQQSPGYDWQLGQGVAAQDRSAASRGLLLSGAQQQALTNYGQGLANQDYYNWYNAYMGQNQFNAAANQQNFGQQQGIYSDTQGQYSNTLNSIFQMAGLGNTATSSLAGTNSGLVANANNALVTSANNAGQFTAQGAQDLASGVGNGINNALLGTYLFRNALGLGGGGASGYTTPGPNGAVSGSGFNY